MKDIGRLRRSSHLAAAIAIAFALASAAAVTQATARSDQRESYTVRVAASLQPRLEPAAVAQIVRSKLGPTAVIQRVVMVASDAEVSAVESNAGRRAGAPGAFGPVWVVRARGPFVGRHVPPGNPPVRSATGYFVISDATGNILGMGMP